MKETPASRPPGDEETNDNSLQAIPSRKATRKVEAHTVIIIAIVENNLLDISENNTSASKAIMLYDAINSPPPHPSDMHPPISRNSCCFKWFDRRPVEHCSKWSLDLTSESIAVIIFLNREAYHT